MGTVLDMMKQHAMTERKADKLQAPVPCCSVMVAC